MYLGGFLSVIFLGDLEKHHLRNTVTATAMDFQSEPESPRPLLAESATEVTHKYPPGMSFQETTATCSEDAVPSPQFS